MKELISFFKERKNMSEEKNLSKEEETLSMHAKITEENFKKYSIEIFNSKHKIFQNLKMEDCKNTKNGLGLFERILKNECLGKGVSLSNFLKYAIRFDKMSTDIQYYGKGAVNIWQDIAKSNNLPQVAGYKFKYILSSNRFIEEEDFVVRRCKESYLTSQLENHIYLPKKMVLGYNEDNDDVLVIRRGTYSIVGAIGSLKIFRGNSSIYDDINCLTEEFLYNIDRTKTGLTYSTGKLTPYGQYPTQMIFTKWYRHAVDLFYSTLGMPSMEIFDEGDIDYVKEKLAQ